MLNGIPEISLLLADIVEINAKKINNMHHYLVIAEDDDQAGKPLQKQ